MAGFMTSLALQFVMMGGVMCWEDARASPNV